jgi:hypothetical protein
MDILLQSIGFGISQIPLVETVEEIYQGQDREETEIKFSAECSFGMVVDDVGWLEACVHARLGVILVDDIGSFDITIFHGLGFVDRHFEVMQTIAGTMVWVDSGDGLSYTPLLFDRSTIETLHTLLFQCELN